MGLVRSKMPSLSLLCYSNLCYSQLISGSMIWKKEKLTVPSVATGQTLHFMCIIPNTPPPSTGDKSKLPVVSQLGNGQEVWFLSSCAQYGNTELL